MNKPFKCTNCGLCCGPVPVTKNELKKIKKEVNKMSFSKIQKLRSQKRDPLTCIFRDLENDKCSIYKARPDICRMFGFYKEMKCPNNPEHATKSREEGNKRIERNTKNNPVVGVLSVNITWDTILKR